MSINDVFYLANKTRKPGWRKGKRATAVRVHRVSKE